MYVIVTENTPGNLHESAAYLNQRPPIYAETLVSLTPLGGGSCVAVYKVPEDKVRWMWGDLRYKMENCPVDN